MSKLIGVKQYQDRCDGLRVEDCSCPAKPLEARLVYEAREASAPVLRDMSFMESIAKFQSRVTSDLDTPNGRLPTNKSELCSLPKVKSTYRA
jgi:hypothetical protein